MISNRQIIQATKLTSPAGMEVNVLNLGATVQSIRIPVRERLRDVVLGYSKLADYWRDTTYMGATVGRYANRIRGAVFTLDAERFQLEANEPHTGNCLHGGYAGLHKKLWNVERTDEVTAVYKCASPDGEGGFPGNVQVTVKYAIVGDCSLFIEYSATSDTNTVMSLANHVYFNLDDEQRTVDQHELRLEADHYTPVHSDLAPTGDVVSVTDSDFDFRQFRSLHPNSESPMRFDHNFCVSDGSGTLREVARLKSRSSGIRMCLHTTQPGLQLYTGDHLTGTFRPRQGVCLEAQAFPDAPNQAGFPSARLSAGEPYRQQTIYDFSVLT